MAPQLNSLGYPVVTPDGIRCGSCRLRHPDTDTVRECHRQADLEWAQVLEETEVERRTARYYEEGF
jgi:uncharacterized OB-fold protein